MDFPMLLIIYLICGAYITTLYFEMLNERNLTSDYFLMQLPENERGFFINHPMLWKKLVGVGVLVLMLIWPYVFYGLIKESE